MSINNQRAWEKPFNFQLPIAYCVLNLRFIDQQLVGSGEAI